MYPGNEDEDEEEAKAEEAAWNEIKKKVRICINREGRPR